MITAERYHDFCYGHRVVNHESKCAHLHGHNGRMEFEICAPKLDKVGRVLDFSVIKEVLCEWLEVNYDHKMLIYKDDPMKDTLLELDPDGVIIVDYNPTAENICRHMVEVIAPTLFDAYGYNVQLIRCTLHETRKCKATYRIKNI